MNYFNSTFQIKSDAKVLKAKTAIKRGTFSLKPKREPPAAKRFKREVRERDNFTCQFPGCGHYSKHIDVHHKAKRSQRPDLKFTVANGICLCREHHIWIDYNHDEAVSLGLLDLSTYELAMNRLENE